MYKGFAQASPEGYVIQEFDKTAPAPGSDWQGPTEKWLEQASANGWIVKTAATDAKPGAIVILADQAGTYTVGIVREVNDKAIFFDTLGQHRKKLHRNLAYQALARDYKITGYIWPERFTARMKLILK